MTKILLSFILLFFSACSQTPNEKHSPMLWEITGKGLKSPSYLFGTFHTRDPETNRLSLSVYRALKSSQRLYTEIPMSEKSSQKVIAFTRLKHAQTLEKRLHPKTLKHLRSYLKKSHSNSKMHHFSPYKTWAIALMIANQDDKMLNPDTLFMDEQLVAIAKNNHIKRMGLETPLEQLHYFDTLNKKEEELFLTDMLRQSEDKSYKDALVQWYKKGEASGFARLQEEFKATNPKQQQLDQKLLSGLLYERNIRFQRRIDILLQHNPNLSYFFAIGAGHLADNKGLVSTLKHLGYTLKKLD